MTWTKPGLTAKHTAVGKWVLVGSVTVLDSITRAKGGMTAAQLVDHAYGPGNSRYLDLPCDVTASVKFANGYLLIDAMSLTLRGLENEGAI